MKQNHYMVDLETLGLRPHSIVLSLGMVKFDPFVAQSFALKKSLCIILDKDKQKNRTIDADTLAWWKLQSNMPTGGSATIQLTCETVEEFMKISNPAEEENIIWAKGTDFDIPALYSMFSESHIKPPWEYYNARDLRTLAKLFPDVQVPENLNKHDALSDAICQAKHVVDMYEYLGIRS